MSRSEMPNTIIGARNTVKNRQRIRKKAKATEDYINDS